MLKADIKNDIENRLSCLINQPLSSFGRAGNLLWAGFGDKLIKKSIVYKEISNLVSRYSLNVSCAWRLLHSGEIFTADYDFYVTKDNTINWDIVGNNRFDERRDLLLESIESKKICVRKIESDFIGGVKIFFDEEFILEIFPNDSLREEYWRFFERVPNEGDDNPHFVVYG